MKAITCFLMAVPLALVACGGGGGGGTNAPTPPQQPQVLPVILVTTGVALSSAPALSNGVTVVSSAAALEQLASGRFALPQSLSSFNYAQGDVVYVEGAGNNDPASAVRLLPVNRVPGTDSLTSELCSSVAPAAGTHSPFALYTVPKLQNVQALASSTAVFPFESNGDNDPNLYLRLMGIYANGDGTLDVITETCGATIVFILQFNHYALYAVSRFDGEPRLFHSQAYSPTCLTSR